jgi:hypothetical protein
MNDRSHMSAVSCMPKKAISALAQNIMVDRVERSRDIQCNQH